MFRSSPFIWLGSYGHYSLASFSVKKRPETLIEAGKEVAVSSAECRAKS
jgi:hypothetical protein